MVFQSGFTQKTMCVNNKHDFNKIFDKILLVVNHYNKKSEISNTIINVEVESLNSDSMRLVVTQDFDYVCFLAKRPTCYFLNEDYMICIYYQDEVAHNDTTWLKQLIAKSKMILRKSNTKILSWEKRTYTIIEPVVIVYDPPIVEYIIKNDKIIGVKNRMTPLFEDAFLSQHLKCGNHEKF
jgi:hypothetical protein